MKITNSLIEWIKSSQIQSYTTRRGTPTDLMVDGVERRRQRPKKPEIRANHYSGTKKGHYDKNVVIVDTDSQHVRFRSPTLPGAVHDKAIVDHVDIR